jgi:TfoX/Sxy family transcriptional regulator of competence genes
VSTKQSTADYLEEQLQDLPIRTRKMFGEYALYCDEKVVAFICDDQLFIKPIPEAKEFIGNPEEAPPYPGAKNYYLITADKWEDSAWLKELIEVVAAALPLPKKKLVK